MSSASVKQPPDFVPPTEKDGSYQRQFQPFRSFVGRPSDDGKVEFDLDGFKEGRYLLYVNYVCPWAARAMIVRKLKKLENSIPIFYTSLKLSGDNGWLFIPGEDGSSDKDPVFGATNFKDFYLSAHPDYKHRWTTPVLFDTKTKRIVNNESADIIRNLNELNTSSDVIDLYPQELQSQIDEMNEWVYDTINNGVYKAGFAKTQAAYEPNVRPIFESFDRIEKILSEPGREYLLGGGQGKLTEADIRLYCTVCRFDVAYFQFFRCNLKMIKDYPHLFAWLKRLYSMQEFSSCTDFYLIKKGYAQVSKRPTDEELIIPLGPENLL